MDFSGSIIATFVTEAKELLAKMEEVLLKIEQINPTEQAAQNADLINDLFRSAHTLKGAASMFGFTELSGFAHEIENLLATVRENKSSLSKVKVAVLLESVDCLSGLLEGSISKNINPQLVARKQSLLDKLRNADTADNNIIQPIQETQKIPQDPIKAATQELIKELKPESKSEPSVNNVSITNAILSNFIKIDPGKLDEIINLIGEIVIIQSYINNLIKEQEVDYMKLSVNSEKLSELIEKLKDLSLQLRMLPIKEIFSKFNRIVRDVATQKNKQIKLQMLGEDTELDRIIMEKINDPLLHLIRNACDHGIDSPEERVAVGKPVCGLVTLQACQENGEVVINTSDDGRGIDLDRVKQKAVSLGMVAKDTELSEQEILSYIFEPGFSTAEQITDISGRGVGMDVVKKEIEKLHGSINIKTKKMQGTTISIRLPLSLAIIEGLLIKTADFLCVVPLWNVIECVEIMPEEHKSIKRQGYLNLRNKILPVIILSDFWGVQNGFGVPNTLIIVQYTDYKIGIIVDDLQGEIQTVIKPMPEILNDLPWINGTAVLGGGEIAVILDIPGLVANVIEKHKHLSGAMI
ncbi:MAG: chemotaxis protein CheA [Gammaproteobacteria bacterium]